MRRLAVLAAVLAAGAALALATGGHAATATGGLSISPAILQQPAATGPAGPVTVVNRSDRTLQVTVAARPWRQTSDGRMQADRARALPGVAVAPAAFSLAPGASQAVSLNVTALPAGGALYGALEVIGLPPGAATAKGVVVGYRLIGTLRLTPAAPVHKLTGALKVRGSAIELDVTNAGNTVDLVSGDVSIREARGTRSPAFGALRILPGRQVRLRLAKGLSAGSYRTSVKLRQAGHTVLSLTAKLKVR
jgi:P pilus assembly chaperone PapD